MKTAAKICFWGALVCFWMALVCWLAFGISQAIAGPAVRQQKEILPMPPVPPPVVVVAPLPPPPSPVPGQREALQIKLKEETQNRDPVLAAEAAHKATLTIDSNTDMVTLLPKRILP